SDVSEYFILFFFFSSRRRHTRFSRDWSSDVCSSDLQRLSKNGPMVMGIKRNSSRFMKQQTQTKGQTPKRTPTYKVEKILVKHHGTTRWTTKKLSSRSLMMSCAGRLVMVEAQVTHNPFILKFVSIMMVIFLKLCRTPQNSPSI